jgi:hypothetical protein
METVAVDTRLEEYVALAGIVTKDKETTRKIMSRAADLLSIPRSCFDHSIWQYIGAHNKKRAKAC